MNHVNVAEVYLVSHKTKTLNPALEHVDGVTDPRIKITSQSSSNDSGMQNYDHTLFYSTNLQSLMTIQENLL